MPLRVERAGNDRVADAGQRTGRGLKTAKPETKMAPEQLIALTPFEMVASPGIEPGTQGFSVLCSTN